MAHLLAPQPPWFALPVFFNVDGVVGALPAQNKREDVLLVQFAFKIMANTPTAKTPADLLAAARAVKLTGIVDPETINTIRLLQEALKKFRNNPGKVVDGRVSPARGGYSYSGASDWSIVNVNSIIRNRHIDIWPRIDIIPGCPTELKQMVVRTVAGTS